MDTITLCNDVVELRVPCAYGPRVSHFGFVGEQNLFAEVSPDVQRVHTPFGEDWHIYGGHRLWYAPEHPERSYYPDNAAPEIERSERSVQLRQLEAQSGIEKVLTLELREDSHVVVRHQLRNRGSHELELAPWALTAMAPGGRAFFPHPPFMAHPQALAPARALVLWPFTRMNDPRFSWGERFITMRQDTDRASAQKIGLYDPLGYMGYALGDQLFLKRHTPRAGAHADLGCNVQAFTNELFLELETLGPLVRLAVGEAVSHDEHWFLFRTATQGLDEAALAATFARCLDETRVVQAQPR